MNRRSFVFKVDCPPERITAQAFGLATDTFVQILAKADARDWPVTQVRIASVDLVASPFVTDPKSDESFAVIDRLLALAGEPMAADRQEVEEFKHILDRMSGVINATGADIALSTGEGESIFDALVLNEAQSTLRKAARRSFGHVTGRIDKMVLQQAHGNRTLGLLDELTGLRVSVDFNPTLDAVVSTLTPGTQVDVKGFIRTNADRSLHLDAEEIVKVVGRHHEPVTSDDLEGLFDVRLPSGADSVSLIRALRDADGIPGSDS